MGGREEVGRKGRRETGQEERKVELRRRKEALKEGGRQDKC